MEAALHIDELPPELISNIFSFLDGPAPSDTRLHDQPSLSMLSDPTNQSLKSISLVSKRWRAICLPFLFRHVVWAVDCWNLITWDAEGGGSCNKSDLPLLESFIKDNNLGRWVESVTLCLTDNLFRNFWNSDAAALDAPSLLDDDEDLEQHISTLSVEDARSRAHGISMWRRRSEQTENWNWLWERLFKIMNPNRFTMIGLPRVLAYMISTEFFTSDAWHFKDQIHILSLEIGKPIDSSVDPRAKRASTVSTPADVSHESEGATRSTSHDTKLFTIRPWKALLLNEGSSIQAYRSYEFYHRRPPSILESLLGCRREVSSDKPLMPPSVRSLSYVAIFPLSSHFNSVVTHLPATIDRLFMQIVPRNGIMEDQKGMERIQPGDLWMERNTCYSLVMRQLFEGTLDVESDDEDSEEPRETGWRNLVIFESGDAADREAWEMAVEYVRMSGTPWTVEADGVLVRHPEQARWRRDANLDGAEHDGSDDEATGPEPQTTDEGFELFKRQLMRFAWNGTEHIPGSPARHYAADDELF